MMLRKTLFGIMIGVMTLCTSEHVDAALVDGEAISASNTFQNTNFTGGNETIFDIGSRTFLDPGVEFAATDAQPFVGGLYQIDFSESSVTFTLNDNSGLSFLQYDAGTFDRYYFSFGGSTVDSVSVASGDAELITGLNVSILAPGFTLGVADLFATGLPVSQTFSNGGFSVEFGENTDLSVLGRTATINFTTTAVPEPSSVGILCGLLGLAGMRRWKRTVR